MPIWTNKHDVDRAIADVVEWQESYRPRDCDASVTELWRPAQIAYLEQIHDHEIEIDVSDRLFVLLGWAVHEVLAKAAVSNALMEERLFTEVAGWKIGGRPDLYLDKCVTDWKVTSVWSFVYGIKDDWKAQTNCYGHLFRQAGFPVENLKIKAILRDWSKSRTDSKDYPPSPFAKAPVDLWPEVEIEERLHERVLIHQEARKGNYRGCTGPERWARPDVWAVKKKKQKKAMRGGLQPTLEAAQKFIEEKGLPEKDMAIEERKGASVRCGAYCDVLPWCAQGKRLVAKAAPEREEKAE